MVEGAGVEGARAVPAWALDRGPLRRDCWGSRLELKIGHRAVYALRSACSASQTPSRSLKESSKRWRGSAPARGTGARCEAQTDDKSNKY